MCELCLKQLKHEAVEYFKCLYDYDGKFGKRDPLAVEELDEDGEMSEATYNQIIAMHECMQLHEILKMVIEREEALYRIDQKKKSIGVVDKVASTFNVDEDTKNEYMKKFKKLVKEEYKKELEKLYEELGE